MMYSFVDVYIWKDRVLIFCNSYRNHTDITLNKHTIQIHNGYPNNYILGNIFASKPPRDMISVSMNRFSRPKNPFK